MTASGHKKFLFDLDFSPDTGETAQQQAQAETELAAERDRTQAAAEEDAIPEIEIPTFSEEDVQRARDEGYQTGQADATRDLASAVEQRLANTLDAINAQTANLFEAFELSKEENSRDAVAVATVIVRKLFPALNMDSTMAEIEHMIIEAMQRTSGSPTLVVRVPADIQAAVEAKANELAAPRGREGTITVMVDETMAEGDVAVEWDGGGMTRDTQAMWQEIDQIIERNLGAKRANGHIEATKTQPQPENAPTPEQEGELETALEVVNEASVGENEGIEPESPPDQENVAEPALENEAATVQTASVDADVLDEKTTQDAVTGDDTPDGAEQEG